MRNVVDITEVADGSKPYHEFGLDEACITRLAVALFIGTAMEESAACRLIAIHDSGMYMLHTYRQYEIASSCICLSCSLPLCPTCKS